MLHSQEIRCSFALVIDIWHHSVSLLIIGFRIVHFFEQLPVSHDRFAQLLHVRPQSAIHLRLCVPSWICGLSTCRHLLGFVQLLPVSFHSVLRVLVQLSRLLVVAVANELATLRCVSLAVSASQERKQRGTVSRYC